MLWIRIRIQEHCGSGFTHVNIGEIGVKSLTFKQCCGAVVIAGAGVKVPAPGCGCVTMGFCGGKVATILIILVKFQQYFQELKILIILLYFA